MKKWLPFYLLFTLLPGHVMCQWCGNGWVPDSSRAIRSSHRAHRGNAYTVQLGYIDTNIASGKEFLDNNALGLTVFPRGFYDVISFELTLSQGENGFIGPYRMSGNKIDFRAPNVRNMTTKTRYGDRLIFNNIKARKKDSSRTISFQGFYIQVVE